MSDKISLTVNAKVNLYLAVTEQRPDGYHNIQTIFQSVGLCDSLAFSKSDQVKLLWEGPRLPVESENIIVRAVALLQRATGRTLGAEIMVKKRIPIGGGLGGGSADAAATLVGLNNLYDLSLSEQELSSLAAQLGADVPFFLRGGTALGTGRGDRLTWLSALGPCWAVIVKPSFSVSTAWAYGEVSKRIRQRHVRPDWPKWVREESLAEVSIEQISGSLYNDFEPPVFEEMPILKKIKEDLLDAGSPGAMLSGSGSCLFGLAENQGVADRIREKLLQMHLECEVWMVRFTDTSIEFG